MQFCDAVLWGTCRNVDLDDLLGYAQAIYIAKGG